MYGAFERASMSPGMALALWDSFVKGDVRDVLPTIGVPTLIIHHTDEAIPVENARYAAEHIPGARFVELTGSTTCRWIDDADRIADEIEEFLTGCARAREPDRVLATVLFTDIVGSTEQAADIGDQRWRELLERHDAVVRARARPIQGREIKHTGDGFLATFDGPAAGHPLRPRDPRRAARARASRSEPACTPASASSAARTSAAWPSTSARG